MGEVLKTCRCPICGKVAPIGKYRPFCSKRCADIDLGNWFNELYRVEAEEIDDQDIEALEELASRPDDDEDGKVKGRAFIGRKVRRFSLCRPKLWSRKTKKEPELRSGKANCARSEAGYKKTPSLRDGVFLLKLPFIPVLCIPETMEVRRINVVAVLDGKAEFVFCLPAGEALIVDRFLPTVYQLVRSRKVRNRRPVPENHSSACRRHNAPVQIRRLLTW